MAITEDDVRQYLRPDETAATFIQRSQSESIASSVTFIDDNIQLRPGNVVEVVGGPGSGKSEVLVQIVACTICKGLESNQRSRDIIYLDLDGKLDMLRVIQVITPRVQAAHAAALSTGSSTQQGGDVEGLLEQCLNHFHLVRCCSSFEYLTAILSLDQWLSSHQGSCKLLLLDSVNAFYWADKAVKPSPLVPQGAVKEPPLSLLRVHTAGTAFLTALARKHRLAVVATRGAVVDVKEGPNGDEAGGTDRGPAPGGSGYRLQQRESMPTAWQNAVTGRLVLRADDSPAEGGRAAPHAILAQWQGARTAAVHKFWITQGGIAVGAASN